MYEAAKGLGITLITISLRYVFPHVRLAHHVFRTCLYRPSLMKYHTQLLTLSGEGSSRWTLTRMGSEKERVGVDREIALLEKKLADVQVWEERVRELEGLLSVRAERKEGEGVKENDV
jgi:ATP-binding cassette subfamily D (ALD) long-chain fatty acid import protein